MILVRLQSGLGPSCSGASFKKRALLDSKGSLRSIVSGTMPEWRSTSNSYYGDQLRNGNSLSYSKWPIYSYAFTRARYYGLINVKGEKSRLQQCILAAQWIAITLSYSHSQLL